MKEQFIELYNRADQDAIIPFLQKLDHKERRQLVPFVKQEAKRFVSWKVRQGFQGEEKSFILNVTAFVCYTEAEIRQLRWWNFPEVETINRILPWYLPDWFSEYVNRDNDYKTFVRYDYLTIMDWQQKGYVSLTPERIMASLPDVISTHEKGQSKIYEPKKLEIYPATLDEHIWYIFQYPSHISWCGCWDLSKEEEAAYKDNWSHAIAHYISKGRLDRMRVLREMLLTANRNFNRPHTGWFSDLFQRLQPTTEELLALQDELFACLTCVHTKPVSNTLKIFRSLCKEKQFHTDELLTYLPILLSSETKLILNTTLAIVEIILKQHPDNTQAICIALCTAFLSKDEETQSKTAELIAGYATSDTEINAALASYSANILMSVRPLLADYPGCEEDASTQTPDQQPIAEAIPLLREDNLIEPISSFEDFTFSLSLALDLPEAYYFDLLVDGLIRWGNEATDESYVFVEPALQKAYKLIGKWDTPKMDGLPCFVIVAYGNYLMKQFPDKFPKIEKLREKAIETDIQRDKESKYYTRRLLDFDKLSIPLYYTGFYRIASFALKMLMEKQYLPLLSTPTHAPAWIDPVSLVERLCHYQQQNKEPEDMDMQLAIQRCAPEHAAEAIRLVHEKLTGEYKDLLLFLLGENKSPRGEFLHPAWWMTAGITRSPETRFPEFASFEYNEIPEAYLSGNHSWEPYMRKFLAYGEYNREKEEFKRYMDYAPDLHWFTPDYTFRKKSSAPLFMEYTLPKKKDYGEGITAENIPYLLAAFPNRPDNLYGKAVIESLCSYWEVRELSLATSAISFMQQISTPFREMHYLFLATCLLGPDKTIRNFATQIWTDRIASATINNERLGIALGKIEKLEIYPLKRLTDLISDSLTTISPLHNKALLETIEAMSLQLQVKPIKNLKKLLEIYNELLAQCDLRPGAKMTARLDEWGNVSLLKKMVKQIIGNH